MCNSNNSNDHKVKFESLDTIEQSLIEEGSQYPNDFNEFYKNTFKNNSNLPQDNYPF